MPCPGCGLSAGANQCRELHQEVTLRLLADPSFAQWRTDMELTAIRRLLHDTYCVQHEEWYCGRPKGLAVHLGGLCWALEYGGHPNGYRALQRWVERVPWHTVPYPPEPGIPTFRGSLTIADVHTASDPESLARVVEQWARSVWEAYTALQPLARCWIQEALTKP